MVWKEVEDRRSGRLSQSSVDKCLSHTTEKIFKPNLLFFGENLVSKIVQDKGRGQVSRYPPKLFCLTVPKNFVEELLCFRKFRVSKKFTHKWRLSHFAPISILSHSTKKTRKWNSSTFHKVCGIETFSGQKMSAKVHRGTLLCFIKILVWKNVKTKRRGRSTKFSVKNFVVAQ